MQTFLPYPDFRTSLDCLDNKRLGKQRVEAMQLVNAIERRMSDPEAKVAWINHPACQMWVGYLNVLKIYHDMSIAEWKSRGFKNTMKYYHDNDFLSDLYNGYVGIKYPSWFGDETFHASHRSNLLRKDPVHYGKFGWAEPHDLPYVWSVKLKEAAL